MKKLLSLGIVFLLLSSTFLTFIPQVVRSQSGEEILFFDDFEAYGVGSFPSAGGWEIVWDGRGTKYQIVTDKYAYSGSKSLQLWGQTGWSCVVQRKFSTDASIIGYEFSVLFDVKGIDYEDHPAFFKKGAEGLIWGTYYAVVRFCHYDGKVKGEDGTILGGWTPRTWYKIRVVLDRTSKTYSVWIDGELRGKDMKIKHLQPELIDAIALTSAWPGVKVYYDDVKVFTEEKPYVPPSINWDEELTRFMKYKEMYQTYRGRFLNNEWWEQLADKRAEAAATYNPYKVAVNTFVDAYRVYFMLITGLPISPISHMFLMKDLAESLIIVYNMFLSMYLSNVAMSMWAAYGTYDVRVDLDILIARTDAVILALSSRDYSALQSALNELKQAVERAFVGAKQFDFAYWDVISANPAYDLLPFLTREKIYNGIRTHVICLRETLMLSYADITFLQGKAEALSVKRQDGLLTSRWNQPIIKETYWEVNGKRVMQAEKGQTVNAHILLRTVNVSSVEHDSVEGTVTVIVKKDVAFWPDKEYAKKTWSIKLNPGQTTELVISFVPDEASSLTMRGYFVEVTFSGPYLFWQNQVQNSPVRWDDGSAGAMKNAYPPRLTVQDAAKTARPSGIALVLQETQHRLYLHVYDEKGRHVGLNYETNMVETQIPESQYYDDNNGTIVIILPSNLTNFKVHVDAKYARYEIESYNLTLLIIENLEIKDQKNITDNITKGTSNEYKVQISPEMGAAIEKSKETTPLNYYMIGVSIIVVVAFITIAVNLRRRQRNLSLKGKVS